MSSSPHRRLVRASLWLVSIEGVIPPPPHRRLVGASLWIVSIEGVILPTQEAGWCFSLTCVYWRCHPPHTGGWLVNFSLTCVYWRCHPSPTQEAGWCFSLTCVYWRCHPPHTGCWLVLLFDLCLLKVSSSPHRRLVGASLWLVSIEGVILPTQEAGSCFSLTCVYWRCHPSPTQEAGWCFSVTCVYWRCHPLHTGGWLVLLCDLCLLKVSSSPHRRLVGASLWLVSIEGVILSTQEAGWCFSLTCVYWRCHPPHTGGWLVLLFDLCLLKVSSSPHRRLVGASLWLVSIEGVILPTQEAGWCFSLTCVYWRCHPPHTGGWLVLLCDLCLLKVSSSPHRRLVGASSLDLKVSSRATFGFVSTSTSTLSMVMQVRIQEMAPDLFFDRLWRSFTPSVCVCVCGCGAALWSHWSLGVDGCVRSHLTFAFPSAPDITVHNRCLMF